MQAVILAAGRGLRLRPLTDTTPKALVDVCGTPLIFHTLGSLPDRVTEIFIVVGYLEEQIRAAVGAAFNGTPVHFVSQNPLDGTGSALHLLRDNLHDKFLVVNGDDLYDRGDLERLCAHPLGLLVSPTMDDASSILRDADGRLEGIEYGAPSSEVKLRACGAYALDERIFRYPLAAVSVHEKTEYSLPHTIVEMSRDCDVRVEEATRWFPVGTPEELSRVRTICG